jgi:hypothetical protein
MDRKLWEYKIINIGLCVADDGGRDEAVLNGLGADGWELVLESKMRYRYTDMGMVLENGKGVPKEGGVFKSCLVFKRERL